MQIFLQAAGVLKFDAYRFKGLMQSQKCLQNPLVALVPY